MGFTKPLAWDVRGGSGIESVSLGTWPMGHPGRRLKDYGGAYIAARGRVGGQRLGHTMHIRLWHSVSSLHDRYLLIHSPA